MYLLFVKLIFTVHQHVLCCRQPLAPLPQQQPGPLSSHSQTHQQNMQQQQQQQQQNNGIAHTAQALQQPHSQLQQPMQQTQAPEGRQAATHRELDRALQQPQQQQPQQKRRVREDENTVIVRGNRYTKLECVGRGGSSKVFKVGLVVRAVIPPLTKLQGVITYTQLVFRHISTIRSGKYCI